MYYILDTNAVIYLQQGRLAEPLPVAQYAISVITEMELLSFSGLDTVQEQWLHKFISSIECIELTITVKERAISLWKVHRIKLPDAIIVASALYYGAKLVSNDKDIAQLPSIQLHTLRLNNG